MGMTSTTWVKMTDDHNNMMNRAVPYFLMEGQLTRYNPELLKYLSFNKDKIASEIKIFINHFFKIHRIYACWRRIVNYCD